MTGSIVGPLSRYASGGSIDNVVIFICDSTRTDALPRAVAERGVVGRAIAPSTFTASSLPSLLSGTYPSEHRVWDFDGRLSREPLLLRGADNTGFRADTIWTGLETEHKPPLKMTRARKGDDLSTVDTPFVYVEHDKGGHTPYGYSFEECESASRFFRDFLEDPDDIPDLYARGIQCAADRFTACLDTLEDRGILDETLVVFTSDHGEHLGEPEYGHVYAHQTPMTPVLVDVPLVFAGAGLPTDGEFDSLLSCLDIVPTALRAQGRAVPDSLPGVDLWTQASPETRVLRSEVWAEHDLWGERTMYAASSIWTGGGGYVFHRGSTALRLAFSLYYHNRTAAHARVRPASLSAQVGLLRSYLPGTVTYGDPALSETRARQHLPGPFTRGESQDSAVDEHTREQLENLGYW